MTKLKWKPISDINTRYVDACSELGAQGRRVGVRVLEKLCEEDFVAKNGGCCRYETAWNPTLSSLTSVIVGEYSETRFPGIGLACIFGTSSGLQLISGCHFW